MILEDKSQLVVATDWLQEDFKIGSWYQVMGVYQDGILQAKICRNMDRLDRHLYRQVLLKLKEKGY